MSSKNRGFAAGLAGALEDAPPPPEAPARLGIGTLAGRTNRLAELASGNLVTRPQELVDPARCRLWAEHNRDYAKLDASRCADLIESLKAQGRQEVPAIVRRVHGDPDCDFEVICGARRHWTVSWLRAHNYPEFRFLVEVRELSDEEAFRISDIENRAREDLSDVERARDYLRALGRHYGGVQQQMAERLKVSEAWLSRYLDLARLPADLMQAFSDPHLLKIKHVTQIKPLLKPEDRRARTLACARELASRADDRRPLQPPDVIRLLAAAADPPKKSGSPKKSDAAAAETVTAASGAPVLRIDARQKKAVTLTLLLDGGASRAEAEAALGVVLDAHWPTLEP